MLCFSIPFEVRKKAKIRNQYNQAPQLTQDTIWESDKSTIKHHIQESQEVSPFSAGDHKATKNRQENMTDTKQYVKLNTGAKEIQQVNPGRPDNSQNIRPQPSYL